MPVRDLLGAVVLGVCLLSVGLLRAQAVEQAGGQTTTTAAQVYSLGATSSLVLEDVLVTDSNGHAVDHLPASVFHVQDDSVVQKILSFEHGSAADKPSVAHVDAPGEYGNRGLVQPDGDIVVMLFDDVGIEIADQMYLRLQMLKYLAAVPAGKEVAVFLTNGGAQPLLVQSLTTDHALLVKAIDNSVPKLGRPVSTGYANALAELANIAEYLQQAPGRKQLLWFAGRFPLYNSPAGAALATQVGDQEKDLKAAYRLLERARIQVFPIDVRGVTRANIALGQPSAEQALADNPEVRSTAHQGEASQQVGEWDAMDRMASETGGRAFYSTNALAGAVAQAVDLGGRAYSISYRPSDAAADGRWHAVKVTVDGPYTLSYRRGYFARERGGDAAHEEVARAGSDAHSLSVDQAPIQFQAKIVPAEQSGKRGATTLKVRYGILASDLLFKPNADHHEEAQVKVAAMAYDGDGEVRSHAVDTVRTNYDETQMKLAQRIGVPMFQTIEVARGAKYLLLAVFDEQTGRTGTVQLTIDSAKAVP